MRTTKALFLLAVLCLVGTKLFWGKTDNAIRDNVVMVKSDKGQCSGVQIKAPSGKSYILSAGHCAHLASDGSVTVITEDQKILSRKVIQEDPASDLLLIEGLPDRGGLEIAKKSDRFEAVRTFTHGGGHSTYSTHGLIVDDVLVGPIQTQHSPEKCGSQSKTLYIPLGENGLCIMTVRETAFTAEIIPGSSGGPIVDPKGDLIGIASMTSGTMYYMVRLVDIKAFLNNY